MKSIFDHLSALQHSLDYHLQRHSVITSNLANVETPGYKPVDLRFKTLLAQQPDMLQQTDAKHMAPDAQNGLQMNVVQDASSVSPSPNGNSVSLDREMSKLSANSIRYRATAEMITRQLGMLRYAASDGQRR